MSDEIKAWPLDGLRGRFGVDLAAGKDETVFYVIGTPRCDTEALRQHLIHQVARVFTIPAEMLAPVDFPPSSTLLRLDREPPLIDLLQERVAAMHESWIGVLRRMYGPRRLNHRAPPRPPCWPRSDWYRMPREERRHYGRQEER